MAYPLGVDFEDDGRCAVFLDVDGDGDLDLATLSLQGLKLSLNQSASAGFARLAILSAAGMPALGAIVRVTAAGRTLQDYVHLTEGFMTQVPADLHFGLGTADRLETVVVTWPGGNRQEWKGLPVGKRITLREGAADAVIDEIPAWPPGAVPAASAALSPERIGTTLDGTSAPFGTPGRPLVVNLWKNECAPCVRELPLLAELSSRFESRVAFAGLVPPDADREACSRILRRLGVSYPSFVASPDQLLRTHDLGDDLPIPCTFVFDDLGRLRRAFLRPVEVSDLAPLLDSLMPEAEFAFDLETMARDALLRKDFHKALELFNKAMAIEPGKARDHFDRAIAYVGLQDHELAIADFDETLRLDPAFAGAAHFNRAASLRQIGRPREALDGYRAAMDLDGETADGLLGAAGAAAECGELLQSLDFAARAVRLEPESAQAHLTCAKVLLLMRNGESARRSLDRVLALEPENAEAIRLKQALSGR